MAPQMMDYLTLILADRGSGTSHSLSVNGMKDGVTQSGKTDNRTPIEDLHLKSEVGRNVWRRPPSRPAEPPTRGPLITDICIL